MSCGQAVASTISLPECVIAGGCTLVKFCIAGSSMVLVAVCVSAALPGKGAGGLSSLLSAEFCFGQAVERCRIFSLIAFICSAPNRLRNSTNKEASNGS